MGVRSQACIREMPHGFGDEGDGHSEAKEAVGEEGVAGLEDENAECVSELMVEKLETLLSPDAMLNTDLAGEEV